MPLTHKVLMAAYQMCQDWSSLLEKFYGSNVSKSLDMALKSEGIRASIAHWALRTNCRVLAGFSCTSGEQSRHAALECLSTWLESCQSQKDLHS